MMFYELCDIIFYIKSVKSPNTNFNINDFIFVKNSITRSSSHKLTSHVNHFYFNRLPRLWNSLPIIPLSLSVHIIKQKLKKIFFNANFDSNNACSYHFLCPCFKCSATLPMHAFIIFRLLVYSSNPSCLTCYVLFSPPLHFMSPSAVSHLYSHWLKLSESRSFHPTSLDQHQTLSQRQLTHTPH